MFLIGLVSQALTKTDKTILKIPTNSAIYSPWSCSKPVWIYFSRWTQKIFCRMLVTNQLVVAICLLSLTSSIATSRSKSSIRCHNKATNGANIHTQCDVILPKIIILTFISIPKSQMERQWFIFYKSLNIFCLERCEHGVLVYTVGQGSPKLFLEGRCPAEFSSYPNQTHLKQLIKLLLGILETSMQVCWGKLELNSAGHRPSRTEYGDPCSRVFKCLA